jgi:hypothetical protein
MRLSFRFLPVAFASLSIVAVPLSGCSAGSEESSLTPVAEGTDDITAASKLVGDYEDGRGRFASLNLQQIGEAGKPANVFTSEVIVQCVMAPCPTLTVKGKWFASSDVLTLYPEGRERETYRAVLDGQTLTLSDDAGLAIARLVKARAVNPVIAEVLSKYGVPKMTSTIVASEIDRQAAEEGVTKPFAEAFDEAVKMFLEDEMGLSGMIGGLEDGVPEECGEDLTKATLCMANRADTHVNLMPLDGTTPPEGESARAAWIIEFSVGSFTDHGYYAIIDKRGAQGSYMYSFN